MAAKKKAAKKASACDKAVLHESRICFGLMWFTSEADAQAAAEEVKASGATYNGGWFHGMSCGREPGFDFVHETHGKLFAVSN